MVLPFCLLAICDCHIMNKIGGCSKTNCITSWTNIFLLFTRTDRIKMARAVTGVQIQSKKKKKKIHRISIDRKTIQSLHIEPFDSSLRFHLNSYVCLGMYVFCHPLKPHMPDVRPCGNDTLEWRQRMFKHQNTRSVSGASPTAASLALDL